MVTDSAGFATTPAFQALADPTRREILDLIRTNERSAGEIAALFPVSRPAISRHLRVLRAAGLVAQRKVAQSRVYRLNPAGLEDVDQWLAPYRVFWAARMHELKRYVEDTP
jgi:DNA-binding transcriptional ArsR family regulator